MPNLHLNPSQLTVPAVAQALLPAVSRLFSTPLLLLIPLTLAAQTPSADVQKWLARTLLDPKQSQVEAQVYTASRVPVLPTFTNAVQWDRYATQLRRDVLDKVILRGEAKRWREADRKVEWLDTIAADGYRIRKFRYEAVPGLWIPALLYEPAQLRGKMPVILNVNGHEKTGMSTPYIQERCINLAKRGMLAFNSEFLGRGQLSWDDFNHYKMPQIDLTGTSGLATFYLSLEKSLDIALAHPNADPARVAVTGLSGGGWQTTIISALDTRITAVVPVAGHSSFVTRAQWPDLDLGDSEQTPSDLATLADYLHLSALVAPRPLMFINNAKDNCCFRADYAVGPLLQGLRPIFTMYGAADKLRYFVNHSDGHNYDRSSREELYRFFRDEFGGDYSVDEIPAAAEVRTAETLNVPLPPNSTFRDLAVQLGQGLPRQSDFSRATLAEVVRPMSYQWDARNAGRDAAGTLSTDYWIVRLGRTWNIPVTEITPRGARETVIVIADTGRAQASASINTLLAQGKRVVAIDPMGFGESTMGKKGFLFAMQIASYGERPLGTQAGQVIAIAQWLKQRFAQAPQVAAYGKRTGLIAMVAGALNPQAIAKVHVTGGLTSLRQIFDDNITAEQAPELFCFGLLEAFDIPQIQQLIGRN